jgi:hypothetical protein
VVPDGIDGGPDEPGDDAGATDAFFETTADSGTFEMPDTSMGWSATDDSDGDTIGDFDEGRAGSVDTDADGMPDYLDPDADGDGVSDALEAGDAMVTTPPVDTDSDGTPDFRDLDADGNGVTDAIEGGEDLDADGRPNLLEYSLGTEPTRSEAAGEDLTLTTDRPGHWIARYSRNRAAAGITTIVENSSDLAIWTSLSGTPTVESTTATLERLALGFDSSAPRLFIRLRVSQP